MRIIFRIAVALTAFSFFAPVAYAATIQPTATCAATNDTPMSSMSTEEIGKKLRKNLEDYFVVFMKHSNSNEVSTTKLVLCFIPVGTRFQIAEQILRAAGFTVYPGPWLPQAKNGADVRADISPFKEGFLSRWNASVFLAPKAPGLYDNVAGLEGFFSYLSVADN